jgi:dinuclear metal center YbgI/SA1388 family protein
MKKVCVLDVLAFLNEVAPFKLQEDYDNSGLLVGHRDEVVTGILVTLDCVESVIDEAIQHGANVIVAHHPILFKPLKSITSSNYVERTILKAIREGISIIAIHTNLDNDKNGINKLISNQLLLNNCRVLAPVKGKLMKLVTFVPDSHAGEVLDALHRSGAGKIGNYSECSFGITGTGTFRPNEIAKPYVGSNQELEQTEETRLEVLLPTYLKDQVLRALFGHHPYEEVAYYLTELDNVNQDAGAGMIGQLPEAMKSDDFLSYVKSKLNTRLIRHTAKINRPIQTVAVCGGSGSFLLKNAIAADADAFISADFKYHEFFDADGRILIADVGHHESECFMKAHISGLLNKKFTTFASVFSKIDTNPISYF